MALIPDGTFTTLLKNMQGVSAPNQEKLAALEKKGDWAGIVQFAQENLQRDPHNADWWIIAGYAQSLGLGMATAGLAAAVLAGTNGVVRAAAAHLSDRFGRMRVVAWVLLLEGIAQFALVAAGRTGHEGAFVTCALLVGLGGGAFYAIFAEVVLEYFGEHSLVQNQAVVYSAKAAGGLIGIGAAVFAIDRVGYTPLFLAAGCVALVAALAVRLLRQPGRPTLPVKPNVGTPAISDHLTK